MTAPRTCDYVLPRDILRVEARSAPCVLPDGHAGEHDTGRVLWSYDDDCACCMFDEDTATRCFSYEVKP